MKFTELGLSPDIMKGLGEMGYTDLTPVQEQTFPHILGGRDLIARAETGSGKTSACAIPMAQNVNAELKAVQGLILVPTRELAQQYVHEIASIAKHTKIAPFAVYGGFSTTIQQSKLAHGVHILVATPGRLIDLLYNSPLSLSQVRTFVLDEADEMLNMGFIDDVEFVISCLIHQHQTLLFSATMPDEIKRLAKHHLKDPVTIELNAQRVAPENLKHEFYYAGKNSRFEHLLGYLKESGPGQVLLFCNSRAGGDKLYQKLSGKVKHLEYIHGGLDQQRRTQIYNCFKNRDIKYLVATDIASRGLDFSHVSHVVNYDFPRTTEGYTHRTGRTARMGRKGVALTYLKDADLRNVKRMLLATRIEAIWLNEKPDLDAIRGGGSGRPRGRYSRPGHASHNQSGKTRSRGGRGKSSHRRKNPEG